MQCVKQFRQDVGRFGNVLVAQPAIQCAGLLLTHWQLEPALAVLLAVFVADHALRYGDAVALGAVTAAHVLVSALAKVTVNATGYGDWQQSFVKLRFAVVVSVAMLRYQAAHKLASVHCSTHRCHLLSTHSAGMASLKLRTHDI